jgi:tRNA nucleotidyltransferase/poly(A) polymerase
MADYIYLLENRLSRAQQLALSKVREIARGKGLTVFLVGGAVRDLTSG